ncbi:MAG: hypothetical protein V5A72_03170 [Candidatus Nanohaloarchaea archaeon]
MEESKFQKMSDIIYSGHMKSLLNTRYNLSSRIFKGKSKGLLISHDTLKIEGLSAGRADGYENILLLEENKINFEDLAVMMELIIGYFMVEKNRTNLHKKTLQLAPDRTIDFKSQKEKAKKHRKEYGAPINILFPNTNILLKNFVGMVNQGIPVTYSKRRSRFGAPRPWNINLKPHEGSEIEYYALKDKKKKEKEKKAQQNSEKGGILSRFI